MRPLLWSAASALFPASAAGLYTYTCPGTYGLSYAEGGAAKASPCSDYPQQGPATGGALMRAGGSDILYACGQYPARQCDLGNPAACTSLTGGLERLSCASEANGVWVRMSDPDRLLVVCKAAVNECVMNSAPAVVSCSQLRDLSTLCSTTTGAAEYYWSPDRILTVCRSIATGFHSVTTINAVGTSYQHCEDPCETVHGNLYWLYGMTQVKQEAIVFSCQKGGVYTAESVYCTLSWDAQQYVNNANKATPSYCPILTCSARPDLACAPGDQLRGIVALDITARNVALFCAAGNGEHCVENAPTTSPSHNPTLPPSSSPVPVPSTAPTQSAAPSAHPTAAPTLPPSVDPTLRPTMAPSDAPTRAPTVAPSTLPTSAPTAAPSRVPSAGPTVGPAAPTRAPTVQPTRAPNRAPTLIPTAGPVKPTPAPTAAPVMPTGAPTFAPSVGAQPTRAPGHAPTLSPSGGPAQPSQAPTAGPAVPTTAPSIAPSVGAAQPTHAPTAPTAAPAVPTRGPARAPTSGPSLPTGAPAPLPATPTAGPSAAGQPPTAAPSAVSVAPQQPTSPPTQASPAPSVATQPPASAPTAPPSGSPAPPPSRQPTAQPSNSPSRQPSAQPSHVPSRQPSAPPSHSPAPPPSRQPSARPSHSPAPPPSRQPSVQPSHSPAEAPSPAPSSAPARPSAAPSRQQDPTRSPALDPSTPPSMPPRGAPAPTASPSTPAPAPARGGLSPTAAPSVEVHQALIASRGTVAVVATVTAFAGAAGGATSVAVVDTTCDRIGTLHGLSPMLHPLGFTVQGSLYLGCIVGAILLLLGATALSFSFVCLLRTIDENGDGLLSRDEIQKTFIRHIPVLKDSDQLDVAAVARHPNNILVTFMFLYQGAAFSSLRLLIAPDGDEGAWLRLIGGAAAALLAAAPLFVYRSVTRGVTVRYRRDVLGDPVARARIRAWEEPVPPKWMQHVLLSDDGDWVSCRRENHWINRWQAAVRPYQARHAAHGSAVELSCMWFLGLANTPRTESWAACGHVRVGATVVLGLQLAYSLTIRPYRCPRNDVAEAARLAILIAALVSLATEFYSESNDTSVAVLLLQVATLVIVIRAVLQIAAEVVLLVRGYRANLQTKEWDGLPGISSADIGTTPVASLRNMPERGDTGKSSGELLSPLAAEGLSETRQQPDLQLQLLSPSASMHLLEFPERKGTDNSGISFERRATDALDTKHLAARVNPVVSTTFSSLSSLTVTVTPESAASPDPRSAERPSPRPRRRGRTFRDPQASPSVRQASPTGRPPSSTFCSQRIVRRAQLSSNALTPPSLVSPVLAPSGRGRSQRRVRAPTIRSLDAV